MQKCTYARIAVLLANCIPEFNDFSCFTPFLEAGTVIFLLNNFVVWETKNLTAMLLDSKHSYFRTLPSTLLGGLNIKLIVFVTDCTKNEKNALNPHKINVLYCIKWYWYRAPSVPMKNKNQIKLLLNK